MSLETRLRDAADDLHRSVAHFEAGSADVMVRKQRRVRLAESWAFGLVLAGVIAGTALLVSFAAPTSAPPATGGFSCPPGSTPDQQGPADRPRPPQDGYMYGATTFDPGSGRVLRLTSQGAFWTFDVCTNSWASEPVPEDIAGLVSEFVYDVDSDRFIAFAVRDAGAQLPGDGGAQVWAYEPDGRLWTEKDEWAMGPVPEWSSVPGPQAVYDPVSGLVVVRESLTSAMWTYDVDTDTWTDIDQGATLPPAAAVARPFGEDGTDWVIYGFAQALTYDASVDRLILYDDRSTWEFDIRAGLWEEQDATHDELSAGYGWGGPSGDEFTYDQANEVSVLFGGGTLATYDASEHTWTVLQQVSDAPDAEPPEKPRMCFAMTYDSVNERILVFGGETRPFGGENETSSCGWDPSDEVIAYDVATGQWITLLEPTSG